MKRLSTMALLAVAFTSVPVLAGNLPSQPTPQHLHFEDLGESATVTTLQGVSFWMPDVGSPHVHNQNDWGLGLVNLDQTQNDAMGNTIIATFGGVASNVSFSFETFGYPGDYSAKAISASGNVIEHIDLFNASASQDKGFGYLFQFNSSGIKAVEFSNGGNDAVFAIGELNYTAAAVPEPASWAMLITGFGLTGATMRRRRTAAAIA